MNVADDPYGAGYDMGYRAALADVAAESDRVHGRQSLLALLEQLHGQYVAGLV